MEDFTKIFDYLSAWFEKLVAMFLQIGDWFDKTFGKEEEEEEG